MEHTSRWYVGCLVGYGLASLGLATSFGFVDRPILPVAISMPVWAACVVGLSVWAARRRSGVRGLTDIHLTVIVVWAAAWAATVGMGTTAFRGFWPWWLGGGLVMAATAFAGAWVTVRRSRAGA